MRDVARRARSRRPRCRRSASAAPPRWSSRSGAKPPSSPTAVPRPALVQRPLQRVEDLGAHAQRLGEGRAPRGHDHELLEVDVVVGVRAAVEHVHHRHRQHARGVAAEVAPQRQALPPRPPPGRRRATRRGSRWRRAAPCSGCRRARSARGRAPAGRRRRGPHGVGDLAVDVRDGARDALAAVRARRRRAARPPRTRRSRRPRAPRRGRARRTRSPTSTSTVGIAAAVEDLAGVDLLDLAHSIPFSEPVGGRAQGELGIHPGLAGERHAVEQQIARERRSSRRRPQGARAGGRAASALRCS